MVLLAVSFPSLRLPEQGVCSCGSVLTYTYLGHTDFQEVFVTGLLTPHVEEVDSALHVLCQRKPTLSDYCFATLWSTKMLNETMRTHILTKAFPRQEEL